MKPHYFYRAFRQIADFRIGYNNLKSAENAIEFLLHKKIEFLKQVTIYLLNKLWFETQPII